MRALLDSMTTRIFLVLIAGILASSAITSYLAKNERQEAVSRVRAQYATQRFEQFVLMLEALPAAQRAQVIAASNQSGFVATLSATPPPNSAPNDDLKEALTQRMGAQRQIQGWRVPCTDSRSQGEFAASCRAVSLQLQDGTPLQLMLPPRIEPRGSRNQVWWGSTLLFGVLLCLLAYLVARMSTRPLRQLARAAIALGRDINRPPLPENGASELRHAAAAFNVMQDKIQRHVQDRTQMLAAITHDLQTPLTRMRLRLEKLQDDELRGKLLEDMAAMQAMIRDGLDLARSMNSEEAMLPTDIDSLLDSICADAVDTGQDVTLSGRSGLSLPLQPTALRRCLTNLIDNAVKYGQRAEVQITREDNQVVIQIRDHGLGIPEDMQQKVFDPFVRLENSRSRDTGGTGIGLTIARNIAEKHGGQLTLQNHAQGGLVVRLHLPLTREQ